MLYQLSYSRLKKQRTPISALYFRFSFAGDASLSTQVRLCAQYIDIAKTRSMKGTHVTLRAGDEARTRYPQLGRLMLYQMSYSRLILQ